MEYMCVCVCALQYRPYMTLNSEHLLCSFVLYIYVQRETPMFVAQLTASVFIYTVYHWLIALSLVLSFSPTMLYISKSVQANNATSVMVDLLPRVCGQSTCTLSCSIERVLHVVVLLIKEGTHAASQATPTGGSAPVQCRCQLLHQFAHNYRACKIARQAAETTDYL